MDRLEQKRQAWLNKHKSDPVTAPELTDQGLPTEEIKRAFLSHRARAGRTPDIAHGIFGERSGRDGWIEKYVKRIGNDVFTKELAEEEWKRSAELPWFPKEDGVFLKLYGCKHLFRGSVPEASVHGMELAKTIVFTTVPRASFFTLLGLVSDFLFNRKNFLSFVDSLMFDINHRGIRHYDIPPEEYSAPIVEIARALTVATYNVWKIDLSKPYDDPREDSFDPTVTIAHPHKNFGENRMGYILARIWRFVLYFLQQDYAYRSRFQDAIGQKPKDVFELLHILKSRETASGIGNKWRYVERGLRVLFFLEPQIKQFLDEFFRLLDPNKVQQDEADLYFSLMYHSYNFAGKGIDERFKLWDEMNERAGNVFLFHLPEVN